VSDNRYVVIRMQGDVGGHCTWVNRVDTDVLDASDFVHGP